MIAIQPTRQSLVASAAIIAVLALASQARAAVDAAPVVPPRLSVPAARYYATHQAAYAKLLAHIAPTPGAATPPRFSTASGGTWERVTPAPKSGLSNPLLLTDGSVLVASANTPDWFKLTPDSSGNYAHGTWSAIATLPAINGAPYAPLYHASGLLPDGRVIIEGGEYNGSNSEVWTNDGALYDPVADSWTAVYPPLGTAWGQIGDAQSAVLADGTFMLAACCAYNPPADALFNPKNLSWKPTGAPHDIGQIQYQDEQGYELLPNGDVLTVSVWSNYPNGVPTDANRYNPGSGKWTKAGTMPASLVDPVQCGNFEIGPAVLRGDGTVVGFGGNTGCIAGATDDPTDIYDTRTNKWTAGPYIPAVCGSDSATSCDLADAPAALLPTGNILFAASDGYGGHPTHFFEYSSTNTIAQVSDPILNAGTSGAYYYNFLVLPNGQILMTDFSRHAELYTPAGAPISKWAPAIYNAPTTIAGGKTYQLAGEQFSGITQGAYYGDDVQGATNFPIVRITNVASGGVAYARTSNFSTMSVAPKTLASANFTVPTGIAAGPSMMEVIANGIASTPVSLMVK